MHAVLSPSGAHRWMSCPGSAALESVSDRTSSIYADEGTAAHLLATWCLKGKTDAVLYLGEEIRVGEHRFPVDKDMVDFVQSYVDFVRGMAEGGILLVEQRVPISHLTGEPGAGGTADVIILYPVERHMVGIDLKYGMGVKVYAPGNPQTRIYGLGSLEKYDIVADFDTVEMVIHQPRLDHVSTETLDTGELDAFAEVVRECAEIATGCIALWNAGGTAQELFEGGYLVPGEEQCRFCDAKPTCPALRAEVMETCRAGASKASDFASLFPIVPDAVLPANDLAVCMSKVEMIEDWCKGIRTEVDRRLLAGQEVPGYKVVTGKQGDRKWTTPEAAEASLKRAKVKAADMYDKKLISPTTAEKLLKKTNPDAWDKMQSVITRAPGKPSVAPASDPRPALAITKVADVFRALT